jgi:hypothetical protein
MLQQVLYRGFIFNFVVLLKWFYLAKFGDIQNMEVENI